jgi:hypothetical protein
MCENKEFMHLNAINQSAYDGCVRCEINLKWALGEFALCKMGLPDEGSEGAILLANWLQREGYSLWARCLCLQIFHRPNLDC